VTQSRVASAPWPINYMCTRMYVSCVSSYPLHLSAISPTSSAMNACFACGKYAKDKNIERLLRCGRCKYALYCDLECQRSDWKKHKKLCRSPPKHVDSDIDATFLLPANAPKMIDLGSEQNNAPLPLKAFHQLDGFGKSSMVLMFSDHAGKDALKPYVIAYFGEINDENGWNAEGLTTIPWGIVTSPMHDLDDARRILGPSEAVFNKSKFPEEIKALLDAGIITDTGKTYKMGYYDPHPVCKINLPLYEGY
jgi:hypothetical protein